MNPPQWPPQITDLTVPSTFDGEDQPLLYYEGSGEGPRPLLVALHSWSADYKQPLSIPSAEWCVENGWAFVHPSFRGPNRRPEACASDAAVRDILDAVDYAIANTDVDTERIYLVGGSGGGHMALAMAGRHPERWSAVSAWCPITDVAAWHFECRDNYPQYAEMVAACCGGAPRPGSLEEGDARRRSPLYFIDRAKGLPIDLNAGIRDGHDGPVPVHHTLWAFNALAEPDDRIGEDTIRHIVERAEVPEPLRFEGTDDTYGDMPVLMRRESGSTRVTLFDGGHDIVRDAAHRWLAQHRRKTS